MFAVGMCVDERYLAPALVAIGSLAETIPQTERRAVAIRVLALDLSRTHAETLAAYVRHAGFASFDLAWSRPPAASTMNERSYITSTTYLRFGFTPRFVQRPYLIYLDADVLALGAISAPLSLLEGASVGMVTDEFNPTVGVGTALPGLVDRCPQWRGRPYFNAGVLWLSTGALTAMRKGVERAQLRWRHHIHHNDQDALNLWLLESGRVRTVPGEFNRFELGRFLERGDWVRRVVKRPLITDDARLIHYVGPIKPWSASCPVTEDVVIYRGHLAQTMRQVRRLGDLSIEPMPVGAER